MIRLSIQARQALAKLTLPLLIAIACAVMLLGQADHRLAERARIAVADALAPFYALLARPIDDVRGVAHEAHDLVGVSRENERLRAENMRLRRWYDVAMALATENEQLKANLHWMPEQAPSFVTGRAVADTGGIYARSVLLSVEPGQMLSKGMIAVDSAGLIGRVTEVGDRSARIMLITDMTSRTPVTLEASHAAAIVAGTNTAAPRLMNYPEDVQPEEGERVVTKNVDNVFPSGLPVGTVHYLSPGQPVVEPYARLDHVGVVRIFDYGLSAIVPPEAPGRVLPHGPTPQPSRPQRAAPHGAATGSLDAEPSEPAPAGLRRDMLPTGLRGNHLLDSLVGRG